MCAPASGRRLQGGSDTEKRTRRLDPQNRSGETCPGSPCGCTGSPLPETGKGQARSGMPDPSVHPPLPHLTSRVRQGFDLECLPPGRRSSPTSSLYRPSRSYFDVIRRRTRYPARINRHTPVALPPSDVPASPSTEPGYAVPPPRATAVPGSPTEYRLYSPRTSGSGPRCGA